MAGDARQATFDDLMRGRHPDARRGYCRWCGGWTGSLRRRWHPACQEELATRLSWGAMRQRVADRDGACCAACGLDCEDMARELRCQVEALGRVEGRWLPLVPGTFNQVPVGRVLLDSGYDPSRSLWEVDHVLALADGGSAEPEWLWVLCQVCHRRKTSREALLRAGKVPRVFHRPFMLEKPADHKAWWVDWLVGQASGLVRGGN